MDDALLLLLTMVLPLLGAIVISRLGRWPNIRELAGVLVAVALFAVVLNLYIDFRLGMTASIVLAEPFDGLPLAFSLNTLGLLFALVASGLWIVTTIYAIGYMRAHHEGHQTRFFAFFAVSIAAVMAISFSDNLFTLFVFYELLTLATYPLVTHSGTPEARRSGRIYLTVLMGSSIGLFLFGLLIVWSLTGSLTFTPEGILKGHIDDVWVAPLYLLFVFGIGKAAVMPMHKWLPAAMVAPTPVSALLHAVAVVKAGVFTLLKVTLFIFGPGLLSDSGAVQWLIWLPVFTILMASLIAMTRDNLKERLAYSTISQLSYIVLGTLLANEAGLFGASLHIVMHAFAKIALFFAAGAILVAAHKTRVSELDGLGVAMPITFGVFMIGALSIIGLPPFGGMWSKWYLAQGTLDFAGPPLAQYVLLGTLMVSSLLNIAYLLEIPFRGFFKKAPADDGHHGGEAPLPCLVGLVLPAAFCVYLFFSPEPFFDLLQAGASSVEVP
ncbi:monovalent cation/H+ antiporter subunit D family protein [Aestuariibacter halophilus]|uniref:Monovalent cation/H+ antiporter subunit D family protein n=1 Tax=Fluctibacter halophilus TaxID=226011 RepID=A0ABS8G6X8_9ALTE|nr:proton-conducting transporter membrane subunit [Aestuariibacter halophilus]MCC2616273.1 monovalent cation/H+ antiporter subunit D family protein [Aestuariibacter halophilus]